MRAISDRRSGVSFRARAGPPFLPPLLPRATAAGFLRFAMPRILPLQIEDWREKLEPVPRSVIEILTEARRLLTAQGWPGKMDSQAEELIADIDAFLVELERQPSIIVSNVSPSS